MKYLIEMFVLFAVSGLIGLIVCGWLAFKKETKPALIAGLIFFGGPLALLIYRESKHGSEANQFDADVAYVKELCAKQGGDKIYKTVENVEGVFQMKPRAPVTDAMMQDQYGMPDPYGLAQGDDNEPSIYMGLIPVADGKTRGYWFIERRASGAESAPYKRKLLRATEEKIHVAKPGLQTTSDGYLLEERNEIQVAKLRSRYGYLTEEISTKEMRSRWIAGGRIKIIDLQTNEVLAERTGYFRAPGTAAKDHWSGGGARLTQRICPNQSGLGDFLSTVLVPPNALPTKTQLDQIKGE